MEIQPINTSSPLYAEAEALMADAFPPEERRPQAEQRERTDHQPLFHPNAILEDGKFAGLLNYWTLDGFIYAEHLATLPSLRGNGLGRRIMDGFIRQAATPIVLEVEPPTDELKQRRIHFYQRCGFVLWEQRTYTQPPYSSQLPPIPLRLMVHGSLNEERDFDRLCLEIYTHVYGCTPEEARRFLENS